MSAVEIALLVAGGLIAGIVNAFAGGGSFLTFPLLMAVGLPPQVANATNRVAIVLQCTAGSATYHRHGVFPWRPLPWFAIPMVIGAVPGAMLASHLDESSFRKVSAFLLVAMISTIFIDSKKWTREKPEGGRFHWWHAPVFVLVGVYGGFLQAGIGPIMLGLLVLTAGFDVVRGNAIRFGLAGIFNLAALLLFASQGQVNWLAGAILAVGNTAGGVIGAHLVVRRGTRWVRYVVLASGLAAVAKLLLGG
ncbi:MAG: sulfite exporter TauE/SafE family protein [Candidatus Eisenbacteria bacterium]|nr:sulfite exporter TauE/SafE family protein [Candidatus Eisenbacteria bacterium]